MKKYIKPLIALVLSLAFCFSLCSCQMLDEMRAEQAFYLNEDKTEILWKGDVYKLLPTAEANVFADSYDHAGYVTEKDVPVLLASMDGYTFSLVKPYGFLHCPNGYYCKENEYDGYAEKIGSYKLDKYAFITSYKKPYMSFYEELNIVDGETAAVFDLILENYKIDKLIYETEWKCSIFRCDENKMMYDSSFELVEAEGVGYFLQVNNKFEGTTVCEVPEQYNSYFDDILLQITEIESGVPTEETEYENAWTEIE